MTATDQHLKRIQEKLQLLLKQHNILQKENADLREQVEDLKRGTTVSAELVDHLKQQVEILRFSNGSMEEEERKQFQKRLNAYVKEIDRCIALLSQ